MKQPNSYEMHPESNEFQPPADKPDTSTFQFSRKRDTLHVVLTLEREEMQSEVIENPEFLAAPRIFHHAERDDYSGSADVARRR
jgi:hypothetical protein